MYAWNEMVQLMVDWVEDNITESSILLKMSEHLGYSASCAKCILVIYYRRGALTSRCMMYFVHLIR